MKLLSDKQRKNESLVAAVLMDTLEQYGRAVLDCGCEIGNSTVLESIKVIRSGWCFNTYPDQNGRYWTYCNTCVKEVMNKPLGDIVSVSMEIIPPKAKELCGCTQKCDPCTCKEEEIAHC